MFFSKISTGFLQIPEYLKRSENEYFHITIKQSKTIIMNNNNNKRQEKKPKHNRQDLHKDYDKLLEAYTALKEKYSLFKHEHNEIVENKDLELEELETLHECLCQDHRMLEAELDHQMALLQFMKEQRDHWRNRYFASTGEEIKDDDETAVEMLELRVIQNRERRRDPVKEKKILELLRKRGAFDN